MVNNHVSARVEGLKGEGIAWGGKGEGIPWGGKGEGIAWGGKGRLFVNHESHG